MRFIVALDVAVIVALSGCMAMIDPGHYGTAYQRADYQRAEADGSNACAKLVRDPMAMCQGRRFVRDELPMVACTCQQGHPPMGPDINGNKSPLITGGTFEIYDERPMVLFAALMASVEAEQAEQRTIKPTEK